MNLSNETKQGIIAYGVSTEAKPESAVVTPPEPSNTQPEQPDIVVIPSEPKQNVIAPPSPPSPQKATIEWDNSQYLKNIFKALQSISDEVTFKVTLDKFECKTMDPSRVAMMTLTLNKEGCTEFDARELNGLDLTFALNVENFLNRALKNVNKDEDIRLELYKTKAEAKLKTILKQRFTRNFEVFLLDSSTEELPDPKLDLTHRSKLVVDALVTLFKDVESTSDHVRITGTPDTLRFDCAGDLDKFDVTLERGNDALLSLESRVDQAKSTYSVSYLNEFLKVLKPLCGFITFSFASDMPLRIDCELIKYGTLSIFLAPRIDTD